MEDQEYKFEVKNIKNCYHCSNCQPEWYQKNLCTSKKVRIFEPDKFGNVCGPNYPYCDDILPDQNIPCPYFEISFSTKIAKLKAKICGWLYRKLKGIK